MVVWPEVGWKNSGLADKLDMIQDIYIAQPVWNLEENPTEGQDIILPTIETTRERGFIVLHLQTNWQNGILIQKPQQAKEICERK